MKKILEKTFRVTSPYNVTRTLFGKTKKHRGIDLVGMTSKQVFAPSDYEIVRVGWENPSNHNQGFGYRIWAKDTKTGHYDVFGHLKSGSSRVKVGQKVKAGTRIATEGSTGSSTGSHVHFERRPSIGSSSNLNPANFLGIPNKIGTYKYGSTSSGGNTVEVTLDILKKGSKGRQVKTLQNMLKFYDYMDSKEKVDGVFGSKTLSGVKKLQKANKLSVDGIVGQDTWKKLLK